MTGRQSLATLLAVLAALCAVGGAASWYLRDAVVERQAFADRALDALDRPAVRQAVSGEIAAQVLARVPQGGIARAPVEAAVERTVDTPAFRRAFRRSALQVNDTLFGASDGVATLRIDVDAVLAEADPQLAALLPPGQAAELVTLRRDSLPIRTDRAADLVDTLAAVLPPLACFALAGALLVAVERRRALAAAAIATIVCAGLLLLGVVLGRSLVVDAARAVAGLGRAEARDATAGAWDAYAGGLRTTAIVALAAGLVVGALTLVPWPRSRVGRAR